jgi:CPA2 family monovalent cation:H+ antiporter-2
VALDRLGPWLREREKRHAPAAPAEVAAPAGPEPEPDWPRTTLVDHAVLVGYGRVGRHIAANLRDKRIPFLVVEEREGLVDRLREEGVDVIAGNAGARGLLEAANLAGARWLISAIPNPFEASNLIAAGRDANKDLTIVARAHSDAEVEHLRKYGAHHIVLGEEEIAREMARSIVEQGERPAPARVLDPDEPDAEGDAFEQAQRRGLNQERDDGERDRDQAV